MPQLRWTDLLRIGLRIFGRAWLVCGILSIAVGASFAIYQTVWLYRSASARGTIVALVPFTDPEQAGITYTPRFSFRDDQGHTHVLISSYRTSPPEFTVGQHVPVLYIRNHPSSAKLDRFWELWLVPVVCAGLGAFFAISGYLLLRLERRFA